jgi:hypothetical protein
MSPVAAPAVESAHHTHATREHSFLVARPPSEAFGFFEPAGEKLWAEGWQPVFATDADTALHDGSVFTVDLPEPDGRTIHSVWTITHYDPPHRIEYRNVLIGLRATQITVRCEPAASDATRVIVRYAYHGLTPEGDRLISQMTPEAFRSCIEGWGTGIAAYLDRGTPASP